LLLSFGCASRVKVVQIDSSPQGAVVYLDGIETGTTPQLVELMYGDDPDQRHFIQVRRPGKRAFLDIWKFKEVPSNKRYTLENE